MGPDDVARKVSTRSLEANHVARKVLNRSPEASLCAGKARDVEGNGDESYTVRRVLLMKESTEWSRTKNPTKGG